MIRKILGTKDPKLTIPSKSVQKLDKRIKKLISDLKDTLTAQKNPEGVGLSGSQIGENLKVFAMLDKGRVRIVINPKILTISKKKIVPKEGKEKEIMEGCLSLPNYYGPVKRARMVKIKFLDENGKEKIEEFKGLPAQIVQHEIDHLEGTIFLTRLFKQKKPLYKLENGEWQEVEL